MCNRILHFGAVGSGTAYKLIVNLIGAVQIASLAEGMALAEQAGLDLETVAAAIGTGQAASPQVVRNARRVVDDDHDVNVVFTPTLAGIRQLPWTAEGLGTRAPCIRAVAEPQLQELIDLVRHGQRGKIVEIATSPRCAIPAVTKPFIRGRYAPE